MGPPRRPPSVDRNSTRDAAPPPSQVFTRGRHGVVKTRPKPVKTAKNRRSTSMDPSRRNPRSSNRPSTAPRPRSTGKRSIVSVDNLSYALSDVGSEGDHSIYSAPALTPKKGDYPENREPSSSRTSSPSVIKQQQYNKRDSSPERSVDIQKQHSRTTRKIVDGTLKKPMKLHFFGEPTYFSHCTCKCFRNYRDEPCQCRVAKNCCRYECV